MVPKVPHLSNLIDFGIWLIELLAWSLTIPRFQHISTILNLFGVHFESAVFWGATFCWRQEGGLMKGRAPKAKGDDEREVSKALRSAERFYQKVIHVNPYAYTYIYRQMYTYIYIIRVYIYIYIFFFKRDIFMKPPNFVTFGFWRFTTTGIYFVCLVGLVFSMVGYAFCSSLCFYNMFPVKMTASVHPFFGGRSQASGWTVSTRCFHNRLAPRWQ